MMRSRAVQVVGYTLMAVALCTFVMTQLFQCSMSTELVSIDPREYFDPSAHPLMDSIYNGGSLADIETLLDSHPQWATQPIYGDWYAIHCAGQAGRPEILQLLLDRGADINALGGWGDANVIVSALESEDSATLAFVLDAGADPHHEMADGQTSLEYVREFGNEEMQQVLDERGLPMKSP